VVSISILVMISSVLLFNYNSFNNKVGLDMLAHQVAQWIRDAQVAAMSVRTSGGTLFPGYGLHFDANVPDRFVYFADIDGDREYDALEEERIIRFPKGTTIVSLCGETSGAAVISPCVSPFGKSERFDLVFIRPNPDMIISGDRNGVLFPLQYSRALITLSTVKGYRRTIEAWTTGQIVIK